MDDYSVYLNGVINTEIFPQTFSNQIYFSDSAKFYLKYKSIYSIKYPISGVDSFKLENRILHIHANNYLVVNNNQDVICLTGNSEKAISIFIEPELVTNVFNTLKENDEELLSNPYDIKNTEPMFFENGYRLEDNPLSLLLRRFSKSFDTKKKNANKFGINFFFKVSEALILSQQETFKQIKNIDSTKKSTKVELYRRMLKAKEFINDNWDSKISLVLVASLVNMSPYHFHRTFTSVFGTTPAQYHKLIKMQKAKDLIVSKFHNISQIAEMIGYENIHSFSKAFKKQIGISPSKFTFN